MRGAPGGRHPAAANPPPLYLIYLAVYFLAGAFGLSFMCDMFCMSYRNVSHETVNRFPLRDAEIS